MEGEFGDMSSLILLYFKQVYGQLNGYGPLNSTQRHGHFSNWTLRKGHFLEPTGYMVRGCE